MNVEKKRAIYSKKQIKVQIKQVFNALNAMNIHANNMQHYYVRNIILKRRIEKPL